VSQLIENTALVHWQTLKLVLRYLNVSMKIGLKYIRESQEEDTLEGYVDPEYARNVDTRKSLSDFVFTLYGSSISWKTN